MAKFVFRFLVEAPAPPEVSESLLKGVADSLKETLQANNNPHTSEIEAILATLFSPIPAKLIKEETSVSLVVEAKA